MQEEEKSQSNSVSRFQKDNSRKQSQANQKRRGQQAEAEMTNENMANTLAQ